MHFLKIVRNSLTKLKGFQTLVTMGSGCDAPLTLEEEITEALKSIKKSLRAQMASQENFIKDLGRTLRCDSWMSSNTQ